MCDKILSRRKFLRTLTAGTCAAAIHSALRPLGSDLVYAAPYSNHTLIHIFLSGGMDCASYLVPRGLSAYLDKRPTLGITNPLVLNSAFGLNPLMTNLHNLYQQGMVAFINKVGYPDATRSHEDSRRVYQQAMRIQGTDNRGWLGRFADIYVPRNQTFSLLSFSGSVRDLQSAYVPAVTTQGLDGYNYTNDWAIGSRENDYIRNISAMLRDVRGAARNDQEALLRSSLKTVDNSVTTIADVRNRAVSAGAPNTHLGRRLRDAAKVIRYGLPTYAITITRGGFDTHDNQQGKLNNILSELDAALGWFFSDMTAAGKINNVAVLIESEFGRNTFENGSQGTDHGHGSVTTLIGGRVRGGVYGEQYHASDFLNKRWFDGTTDFREVRAQILGRHLGVNPVPVLPEKYPTSGLNLFR